MMLLSIVVAPLVGALLALAAPRREHAQQIALGAALGALLLTGACALGLRDGAIAELAPDLGWLGRAPLLMLDGLSAPWVVATPLLALVVLAATPRALLNRENVIATLSTAAATEGVLLSRNVGLTALFWILALVPGAILVVRAHGDRSHARTYAVLAIGASVPMIAGAILLARAGIGAGLEAPLDLDALSTLDIPLGAQALPFAFLLAAVAIRMGLFPFHAWLPPLAQRGPVGVVGLLVGVHTGVFLVARVVLPVLPDASVIAMPSVAMFALVACLWGSVLALVQNDLARMIGFIACSKAGMLLVGMASLEPSSLHGALIQSVGSGAAFVGVLMVIRSVDARSGTRDVRKLGGLVTHMPRASVTFFLLAAATVGFPGSLGFIGEDLLVHGVLHAHPLVAGTLLLATALNGITMFRSFCRAFLGRPAARPRTAGPPLVDDLVPRERLATSALIVLLVAFGLAPSPLLGARRDHVDRMTAAVGREPIGGSLRHEGGSAADR
jgi:NADH-quinone oxidoreductase subunit M